MEATLNNELDTRQQTRAAEIRPTRKGDRSLWGIYLLLCLVSLVELYSASSQIVDPRSRFGIYSTILSHGMQLFMGFLIVLLIQAHSYTKFIVIGPAIAVASFVMMGMVLGGDASVNGAKRGLDLVVVSIYPSEFLKLSAALVIALIMAWGQADSKNQQRKDWGVWLSAGVALLFGGILFTQGLTNTILLMFISISMLVIGGVTGKQLLKVLGVYLVAGVLFVLVGMAIGGPKKTADDTSGAMVENVIGDNGQKVVVKESGIFGRMETWINRILRHANSDGKPKYEQPITDENRQEMYGYIAQAHGGYSGVLPGNSRETARLPLAYSDYIYAIIVEEWGLFGGLFVMILYLWLLARASTIASRCNQRFATLLVIGMAVMIVCQALCHMAIVTGTFPVSGQPLPLISKGGTSILVTSIAFGVMLSVSRFGMKTGRRADERAETDALPEAFRSINSSQLQ